MLHIAEGHGEKVLKLAGNEDKQKALRPRPEGSRIQPISKRNVFRRRLRCRSLCRRFRFRPAQPPDGIRAHAPEDSELRRLRFLGLSVLALVLRADELSVNEDMVALVERARDGLAEAVERNDAMPFGFRLPLVVRVLPRLLRGDGQHGEIRAVAADLPLLRVLAEEADELDVIDYVE